METKKTKKKSNLIMGILIAVIVFCGIMTVGSLKGWFEGSDSPMKVEKITGVADIERSGVGYRLEKGTVLQDGDIVETKNGSEVSFSAIENNVMELNENTEVIIEEHQSDNINFTLEQGEIFADFPEALSNIEVKFGENIALLDKAVFSVSGQQGSEALSVYEGTVKVIAEDGSVNNVKAGKSISVIHGENESLSIEINNLKVTTLSNFIIDRLQNCGSKDTLCFSQDKIKTVVEERSSEGEQTASDSTDVITTMTESSSSTSSGSKAAGTCTVSIRCDTILSNMDNLKDGKDKYVPSNGIILATSTVEFAKGETVFDILKRACSYAGIPLEYSYTPIYESYYIEGINNLYEKDCGSQSGWMYKVNGWFPNYGCSSYTLKDGDNIVWCYTCNELGADVGGSVR